MLKTLSALTLLLTLVNLQSLLISDSKPVSLIESEYTCKDAPIISYHIHVVVWERNSAQVAKTMDF